MHKNLQKFGRQRRQDIFTRNPPLLPHGGKKLFLPLGIWKLLPPPWQTSLFPPLTFQPMPTYGYKL